MFGLDDWIASLSEGASIAAVLLVAVLLGIRHATDPDHIAAMTTLVASGRERVARSAAGLGAWWGVGHAITLVAFGIPILLAERYLPERVQQGAETAVAAIATPCGRLRARSESASSTGWAEARGWGCSSSLPYPPRRLPSSP